jgi:hypothetical protein
MAANHPANFSTHALTRTDALYFTVTVFSTVGFGDITAASQSARLVVTAQMLLDLAGGFPRQYGCGHGDGADDQRRGYRPVTPQRAGREHGA